MRGPWLHCFSPVPLGCQSLTLTDSGSSLGAYQVPRKAGGAAPEELCTPGEDEESGAAGWRWSLQCQRMQEHACGSDTLSLWPGAPGSFLAKAPTLPGEALG